MRVRSTMMVLSERKATAAMKSPRPDDHDVSPMPGTSRRTFAKASQHLGNLPARGAVTSSNQMSSSSEAPAMSVATTRA